MPSDYDPEDSLVNYLATFTRKKDGAVAVYALGAREKSLLELLGALIEHVKITDGACEVSEIMCRACGSDRTKPCPTIAVRTIFRELRLHERESFNRS